MKEKLNQLAEEDIISVVIGLTQWISSLVHKKDGTLCLCLDPSDLNEEIKKEHYQNPTLEEILSKVSGATVYSTLD